MQASVKVLVRNRRPDGQAALRRSGIPSCLPKPLGNRSRAQAQRETYGQFHLPVHSLYLGNIPVALCTDGELYFGSLEPSTLLHQ